MNKEMKNCNGDRGHEWGEGDQLTTRGQRILVRVLLFVGMAMAVGLFVLSVLRGAPWYMVIALGLIADWLVVSVGRMD